MMKKELGVIDLMMASVTGMIGSGWLFSAFYASSMAGPYSIFSWLVGTGIVAILALIYADLSSRVPMAGAAAGYPFLSNGTVAGSLNAWSLFLGYASTPPLEVIAAISYLSFLIPNLLNSDGLLTPAGILLAVGLLIFFFALNATGIRNTSRFNNIVSYMKIAIPIITSFFFIFTIFSIRNFTLVGTVKPEGIFTAVPGAGIAFSFLGFRQAVELSGEAKNPQKTVPLAIILSVAVASAIYMIVQIAFIGSLQWGNIKPGDWSALANSGYSSGPMLVLASTLGLGALASVLLFDGIISPLGTSSIYQTTTARVSYRISEMGFLPKRISALNSRQVPIYALIFDLIVMILFVLPFPSWQSLVSVNSDLTIIAYMSGPVSLAIFDKYGVASKGFRLPALKILAPIGFALSVLIVYWSQYPTTLYMSIIALVGLALFVFSGKNPLKDLSQGIYIVIILAILPVISYLGSYGIDLIPFPLDIVLTMAVALGVFYIGTRSTPESVSQVEKLSFS
ncbi:amino acid transporter [Thermoplasma sp. Kam2015]|uniref:APC family permease n=1 Tax=Thermoplasma sp. Kam2015 TaxID=2094122 RepID=UPI000D85FF6F|nr:APC family permease [Thermoplasma sp. Kam2015]PYB68650.1 amino acid transporter [Thermoplasma sp. Kam2015]